MVAGALYLTIAWTRWMRQVRCRNRAPDVLGVKKTAGGLEVAISQDPSHVRMHFARRAGDPKPEGEPPKMDKHGKPIKSVDITKPPNDAGRPGTERTKSCREAPDAAKCIRTPQRSEAHGAMKRVRRAFATAALTVIIASFFPPKALAQAQSSSENLIHIDIVGLRNDKGQLLCALYSSADGFPKNGDKALAHAKSLISSGHAVCEFRGAPLGTYAVSAFHDENSNGKLDTNFLGIPREGVGASNGAQGHFGPPKFEAAAFRFLGGRLEL